MPQKQLQVTVDGRRTLDEVSEYQVGEEHSDMPLRTMRVTRDGCLRVLVSLMVSHTHGALRNQQPAVRMSLAYK